MALVWLMTVVLTYHDARRDVNELMDAHLAQAAALLLVQTSLEPEDVQTEHVPLRHRFAHAVAFQLWEEGEHLRLHSANAPDAPLGPATPGFSDREIAGERWRVYTVWDARREYLIHVGEKMAVREALARELVEEMLEQLVLALPTLALLVWLAVHKGLRPLREVADEVAARDPNHLAPLEPGRVPAEVLPLIERLNGLFTRVAREFERERRFTADAAHELRTPLTAIRAQAQVAQAARSEVERGQALAALIHGVDRAAHLIEQLLTLARVDAATPPDREPVALEPLAAGVLAGLAPMALEKGVEIELRATPGLTVYGQAEWLRILLRNLVDNAIRYSPAGGRIWVETGREGGCTVLSVVDSGPGIPESERERVLERFYRVRASGEEGSGLGLSIVSRIAQVRGAELRLQPGANGVELSVSVRFPPVNLRPA